MIRKTVLRVSILGALAVAPAGCRPGTPETPRAENLIFISLDTTRRDHLSTYGYRRATTPAIDALAEGGAVFDNAIAQMTITNPSHACMFTGLYPHTHKVGINTRRVADERTTLTEILRQRGLRTGAFVSGHPLKRELTGIHQGFDTYDSDFTTRRRFGRETLDRALAWLRGLSPGDPYFLFLHLYDAHGPYHPPPEYLERFRSAERGRELAHIPRYQKVRNESGEVYRHLNDYVDRYDAMNRFQDDLVGELLGEVDLERTLVVLVADHGETLGERATQFTLGHGTAVFGEQIRIPMILRGPGVPIGRFGQLAETVDLLPTILDLLGIDLPGGLDLEGESLAPILRGEAEAERRWAFSSNRARPQIYADRGYRLRKGAFIHAVHFRNWKLVSYPGAERDYLELYDLEADPGEQRDVAAEHPEVRARLLRALEGWRQDPDDDESEPALPPELERQFRSLGHAGN